MRKHRKTATRPENASGSCQDRPSSPETTGEVSQHPRDGRFERLEKLTDVPAAIWKALAEDGKIDGGGAKMEETQVTEIPHDALCISEAAKMHNIPAPTIWRWVRKGLIRVVHSGGGQGRKTLLDAEDLARAVQLYKAAPGQGRDPLRDLKKEAVSS